MIIYVSYSSKDHELAQALALDLGLLGHDVQFEQKQLGGQVRWLDVFAGIESCDLFLIVVSLDTLESYSAHLEYSYAYALNKRILPVLIQNIDPTMLPMQLAGIAPVYWRPGDEGKHLLKSAIDHLPPPPAPSRLPPLRPDLVVPFAQLRHEMGNLSPEFQPQKRIFNNLREFLEREDTFHNATAVLRLLQMHPNTVPQIAHDVERMLHGLSLELARKSRASRRAKWLRDFALLVAGALLVLVTIRGIAFLRPYLGLATAATAELTPEASATVDLSDTAIVDLAGTAEVTAASEGVTEAVESIPPTTAAPSATPNAQQTKSALDAQNTATAAAAVSPPPPTEANPSSIIPTPALSATPPLPTIAPAVYIGVKVEDTEQGVRVTEVGETAAAAGVSVGDYVVAVDGEPIESAQEFVEILTARPLLSGVTFRLTRGSSDIYIRLILSHLDFGVPTPPPALPT